MAPYQIRSALKNKALYYARDAVSGPQTDGFGTDLNSATLIEKYEAHAAYTHTHAHGNKLKRQEYIFDGEIIRNLFYKMR